MYLDSIISLLYTAGAANMLHNIRVVALNTSIVIRPF